MADLIGADYCAVVEITTKDGTVVAAPGQTCEQVDPAALGWLLAQDLIAPVAGRPDAAEEN